MSRKMILWSGGTDSTLILADCLRNKEDIATIAINHKNITISDIGRKVRHNLFKILSKKHKPWPHIEVDLNHKSSWGLPADVGNVGVHGLIQPVIWIGIVMPFLEPTDDLVVGYNCQDCAIGSLCYIKEVVNSLQMISRKTGRVLFPLEYTTKAEVIVALREHRLISHTWYCEEPKINEQKKTNKPCNECQSCRAHKTALWQLATGNCHKAIHRFYKTVCKIKKLKSISTTESLKEEPSHA